MDKFYLILLSRSNFFVYLGAVIRLLARCKILFSFQVSFWTIYVLEIRLPSPVSPPRKFDGLPITGLYYIGRECFSITFDKKFCYSLEAKWSRWGTWSVCTKTCGNGTRIRNRTCVAQNQLAVFAPIYCAGKALQEKKCAQWNCPGEQWGVFSKEMI